METFSSPTDYSTQRDSYNHRQSAEGRASDGQSSPRNVSFGNNKREEEKDKRQKYLTARYGQHQMMLIRKRLAVEDWLYEKLRDIYNCEVSKFNIREKSGSSLPILHFAKIVGAKKDHYRSIDLEIEEEQSDPGLFCLNYVIKH